MMDSSPTRGLVLVYHSDGMRSGQVQDDENAHPPPLVSLRLSFPSLCFFVLHKLALHDSSSFFGGRVILHFTSSFPCVLK